jgi:HEAT repeat protein
VTSPETDSPLDQLSDEQLFGIADPGSDEQRPWDAITELQRRATAAVYARARRLCASSLARERRLGATILAQFGALGDSYHEPIVQLLTEMLETEAEPKVLHALGIALSHRSDPRSVGPLLRHVHHPDADVRYAVAVGLGGQEHPAAPAALIELSADPEPHVRDWATFGLGSLCRQDSPAIRAALAARLRDTDPDTRAEALAGLAERRDPRVPDELLAALNAGALSSIHLEIASDLADPRLRPALVGLRDSWTGPRDWLYSALEEAIQRCSPSETAGQTDAGRGPSDS